MELGLGWGWGLDAGWMPQPTRQQRYYYAVSLVIDSVDEGDNEPTPDVLDAKRPPVEKEVREVDVNPDDGVSSGDFELNVIENMIK